MSVILMKTLFYRALTLQGEIWCGSLLGLSNDDDEDDNNNNGKKQ